MLLEEYELLDNSRKDAVKDEYPYEVYIADEGKVYLVAELKEGDVKLERPWQKDDPMDIYIRGYSFIFNDSYRGIGTTMGWMNSKNVKESNVYASQYSTDLFNRGWSLSSPLTAVDFLRQILPTGKWTIEQLIEQTDLSEEMKSYLYSYSSYGFLNFNMSVRNVPSSKEVYFDSVFDLLPPLDKELVVYRYVDYARMGALLTPGTHQFGGYMSTSFSTVKLGDIAKEDDKVVFLQITVPKGKKCIYIPGSETEIVFPRNTSLQIGILELNVFKYSDGYIECPVIPAVMN